MTLELRNVVKRVGAETHIHETSVELAEDGFNILLGTTLAGKTTLMQLMAGLERPTAGEIWFDGKNVTGVPVQKRNVSMVYQQFINYPNFTVFENIASPLRVARMKRPDIHERVHRMAELLQADAHAASVAPASCRAGSSSGRRWRARSSRTPNWSCSTSLSPTSTSSSGRSCATSFQSCLPAGDCTVVFATTDPMEALLLGGHTAALHEGRITQFGPTAEVYRRPADLRTAQVFSNPPINTAPVVKEGDSIVLSNSVRWPVRRGDAAASRRPLHRSASGRMTSAPFANGRAAREHRRPSADHRDQRL